MKQSDILEKGEGRMRRIEFIGASGTGKSTFFQELMKQRGREDNWITPPEGRIQVAKTLSFRQRNSSRYVLMLATMKLNMLKKSQSNIATLLLKKIHKESFAQKISEYDPIIEVFLQGIMSNTNMESYRKGQFVEFFINLIITDLLMLEPLDKEQVVVFDDGMIHNLEGLTNEKYFNEMIRRNPDILKLCFPDAIIFLELNEEDVFNRRKKRIASGQATMLENNMDDQQLRQVCKESIEESKQLIFLLESYHIPILTIDMDEEKNANLKKVLHFIRNIGNDRKKEKFGMYDQNTMLLNKK